MGEYTVYKHVFPSKKIYIGITKMTTNNRWKNGFGYSTNTLVRRAIDKYGWENIEHEILATNLSMDEACAMEIRLISQFQSNDPLFGYNIESGGIRLLGCAAYKRRTHITPGEMYGIFKATGNTCIRNLKYYIEAIDAKGSKRWVRIDSANRSRRNALNKKPNKAINVYVNNIRSYVLYHEFLSDYTFHDEVCGVDIFSNGGFL